MAASSIDLYIDIAEDLPEALSSGTPKEESIRQYLQAALTLINFVDDIELSIRVVSASESQQLNKDYRGKDKATNVLSFSSDIPEYVDSNHIGDLAICAEVLCDEAKAQNKKLAEHWAHMCVHGLLHLLGYDHINEKEAVEMEAIEVASLAALGIDDPYAIR